MSYERIKEQFTQHVPFFATIGLVLDTVGHGVARARLENRKEITNHLGTLHAGALFTLGEGASGAAVIGAFADIAEDIRALSTKSNITYQNIARGLTLCDATVIEPIDSLRHKLDHEGQVDCNVDVRLFTSSDKLVATMTVTWVIFKRKPKST